LTCTTPSRARGAARHRAARDDRRYFRNTT
jgi:hypothetical protein